MSNDGCMKTPVELRSGVMAMDGNRYSSPEGGIMRDICVYMDSDTIQNTTLTTEISHRKPSHPGQVTPVTMQSTLLGTLVKLLTFASASAVV